MNKLHKAQKKLTYDQQKTLLIQFIRNFEDYSIENKEQCYLKYGKKKYMIQIQKIANHDITVIEIVIDDLQDYFRKNQQEISMVRQFKINTFRYIKIFQKIVSQLMPEKSKKLNPQEEIQAKFTSFLKQQRKNNLQGQNPQMKMENQLIPHKVHQQFDVSIVYGTNSKVPVRTISQICAQNMGQLVMTKAIVVRAGQIRPQMLVATYACDICGSQNYQQIFDSNYKPLTQCNSKKCRQNNMRGKLIFLPGHSKFRSYQQLKIQQTPEQLLRGSIPKSMHLQIRGSLINQAHPGDLIKLQGMILPKQRSMNHFHKDLFFDSYIFVTKIVREKKKYVDLNITEEMRQNILDARIEMDDQLFFSNLAKSIAPQIYGMENVKKALLLQMAGGVTTQTQDHLRIRGEINIALFGDPGIAKSQLLKHISHISPRAVYTTGKGSSGVGLTAAIVIDPITKQLSLEAGALVLADMGVCCIDQFDKMDEYDRTAIHEVMEQQTCSITKAGIITTLNARTAVLAAANPIFGRYNRKQTTQKNLNLPAALLSRFDLIFILLDVANTQRDLQLAKHIGRVHQRKKGPAQGVFTQQFLKTYIAMCREYEPIIPESLNQQMIKKYVQKRQIQMDASREGESYTTMRSLLALIRLSQARAKLRFSHQVSMGDVYEALQIIADSQASIANELQPKFKQDAISAIFEIIKSLCNYTGRERICEIQTLKTRAIKRGFTSDQINLAIKNYENLDCIVVDDNNIKLIG